MKKCLACMLIAALAVLLFSSCAGEAAAETRIIPMLASLADAEEITRSLQTQFPDEDITVIPVYAATTGFTLDEGFVNLFGIAPQHAFVLGLEDMRDNTAYSIGAQLETVELNISVITEVTQDGAGLISGELERAALSAHAGVAEDAVELIEHMTLPAQSENPTFFVNTRTFYQLVSVLLGREVYSAADDTHGIVQQRGLFVYVDDLNLAGAVRTFLIEQNHPVL